MEKKTKIDNNLPIYISVVLSTYNDEKYIAESIQSILSQTYPYFEFIIVNDGSNDGTLEIVKSFQDSRIVLIDKSNTGLIDSLNLGVKSAKYDWIARIDGDDVAEPNRFEEQVRYLSKEVAIVSSQCTIINKDGSNIGKSKFLNSRLGIKVSRLLNLPLIVHPAVIFNKNIFNLVGGYDYSMLIAEDYDLWCKMLTKGRVIISDCPLIRLRKHGGNISAKKRDLQQKSEYVAYVKMLHGISRNTTQEEYDKIINCLNYSRLLSFVYNKETKHMFDYLLKKILIYLIVKNSKIIKDCVKEFK